MTKVKDLLSMRHVFVDESSQTAHQHMVIGALIMPGAEVPCAESELHRLMEGHAMRAELKWTKVSRAKLTPYRDLVDYYFDSLVPKGAQFHAMVVNCHHLDHNTYNQGDAELGFNKFLFQLLLHRVGLRFGDTERIVVDLDSRNTTRDVIELHTALNHRMVREWGDSTRAPFARVAFRDSKSTRLLQLADLLTGCVAWHKNDHDAAPDASAAKCELASHAASRVGRWRLGSDASRSECRINCWNMQLRPRKGRPAV